MTHAAPITEVGMPLGEFIRQYEELGPFELVDGEQAFMSPPKAGHTDVAARLMTRFVLFLDAHPLGQVYAEGAFVMVDPDDPDWVKGSRTPDLLYFEAARFAGYQARVPDWRDKPFALVPDVVVEIVSSNDRYTKVSAKVMQYLQDGVRLVWVIDPFEHTMTVHYPDGHAQVLSSDDTLSGGEVIPGFAVVVKSLFE